jgi:hypothetical protein
MIIILLFIKLNQNPSNWKIYQLELIKLFLKKDLNPLVAN